MITLIMLAVITFMTMTFLILSRRERGSVSTSTDQVLARLAAETALERAKTELLGPILTSKNAQGYGLMVSTNFTNPMGFIPGPPAAGANQFTNVNYGHYSAGNAPLSDADLRQNIANLLYNPRPPVFVTQRGVRTNDFVYYLDLNRNRRYDTNGFLPVISPDASSPFIHTNGTLWGAPPPGATVSNFFVGDPEWIGVLERPELPHSSSNKFLFRYAYMVVPSGHTLDINYIHNQAATRTLDPADDGFMRNEGVGSSEINLAAFLCDLNANVWETPILVSRYRYLRPAVLGLGSPNGGVAFQDALALLAYRYGYNYGNLSSANQLFGDPAVWPLDNVDQYSDGPLMVGTSLARENLTPDAPGFSWPGADNPYHFFTTQELFDLNKTRPPMGIQTPKFVDRLTQAGAGFSSYDRYTFYRMQEQLGTDSAPERRMNLNYMNINMTNGAVIPGMETNMIPWTAANFFVNAANELLHATYDTGPRSVTNIQVWPTNHYTPSVHRLLQLAANMYEATLPAQGVVGSKDYRYPTMFRPMFTNDGVSISISGYVELVDTTAPDTLAIPLDLDDPGDRALIGVTPVQNVYQVPWVISAKKGFPNFNEVAVNTYFQITRRLRGTRPNSSASASDYRYWQQFRIGVSNAVAVETWNSYRTNFPTPTEVIATLDLGYALTNSDNFVQANRFPLLIGITNQSGPWPGYGFGPLPVPQSFVIPLRMNMAIVEGRVYNRATRTFLLTNAPYGDVFEPVTSVTTAWGLSVTNRLRVIIRESGSKRLIDYVHMKGLDVTRDLGEEIRTTGTGFDGLWNTNISTRQFPEGIEYQLAISRGDPAIPSLEWNDYGLNQPSGSLKDNEIAQFSAFLGLGSLRITNLVMQAPFTPTRTVSQHLTWQVNDPLVHYMPGDLVDLTRAGTIDNPRPGTTTNFLVNIGQLNERYRPWGGNPKKDAGDASSIADVNVYNTAVKDPLVTRSDDWEFPTNKYPNVGWLGRVHRGTPWQTVYLKSDRVDSGTWISNWTGNAVWNFALDGKDAELTKPERDRLLFDLFTTAPHENAARGRLSVNQTNLAAWSAVLSGVVVLTNSLANATDGLDWTNIQPAGIYSPASPPPLVRIVEGINRTRSATNQAGQAVFRNKMFGSAGDLLAVPELTDRSPFLNRTNLASPGAGGLTDPVVERIPQQIMSLVTYNKDPHFVVYAYGQALHPAERSIITSGQFFGLCTNYQVTAETAARAVVRIEGAPNKPQVVVEQYNVLPPD